MDVFAPFPLVFLLFTGFTSSMQQQLHQEIGTETENDIGRQDQNLNVNDQNGDSVDGTNAPLMLTPYIKQGRILEAQGRARVKSFSSVLSYSGYLSVSKISHLFFWFFPNKNPNAPLLLWLQGGPGASSMFGLFSLHGPFIIDASLTKIRMRADAWTKTHSVIYMDSPVGAGFSFTENKSGFAKFVGDVARDLYEALLQFFKLFPEQRSVDFYPTGESYAGKYVPAISRKIHEENQGCLPEDKINLKGLAIGNGFTNPYAMFGYGDFLYTLGLIGTKGLAIFRTEEDKARQFISQQKFVEAFHVMDKLILNILNDSEPTIFKQLTGSKSTYNFLVEEDPPELQRYVKFLRQDRVRRLIHVGGRPFNVYELGGPVAENLVGDIYLNEQPSVELLLNAPENYRIMYYTGQLDIVCAEPLANNFIQGLEWNGAANFKQSPREIWRKTSRTGNGTIFGYAQSSSGGRLTQVLVRNAGHFVPFDQSKAALDMITRFTRGKPFGRNPRN